MSASEQEAKLNSQLQELDKIIASESKSKDGLENLIRFYASDPTAQAKAQSELNETAKKLEKLQESKRFVQDQLANVGHGSPAPIGGGMNRLNSSIRPQTQQPKIKARALYNYDATVDTELSFKEGELLTITEQGEI